MSLSAQQNDQLKAWVAQGLTLSQIQGKMQADWQLNMTYMELRFLVDDLGLALADKPEKKAAPDLSKAAPAAAPHSDEFDDASAIPTGGVSVTLDAVVRPNALASGTAVFSDGVKVGWSLNDEGRLGLIGAPAGYRPTSEDLQEFQSQLRAMLESRGV